MSPHNGNSDIGGNNGPNSRQGWGHIRPETVLPLGRLVILSEHVTEAEGEKRKEQRHEKALRLWLQSNEQPHTEYSILNDPYRGQIDSPNLVWYRLDVKPLAPGQIWIHPGIRARASCERQS